MGLSGIVDHDDVGAAAGQHAADRGRQTKAALGRRELGERLAGRGEPGRKQRLVPRRGHQQPAVAGEFFGEVLGVGDVDDVQGRVVAEQPSRQGDGRRERLQVPRRHVDDQPAGLSVTNALQFRRQRLDVPGRRIGLPGVQFAEGAHEERIELFPDEGVEIGADGDGHAGGRLSVEAGASFSAKAGKVARRAGWGAESRMAR